MQVHRLKQVVINATVVATLCVAGGVFPGNRGVSVALAQGIPAAQPTVDNGPEAKAARRAARAAADDASFSSRTATRREPKAALKGISMTTAEKNATSWIAEKYLDRAEDLDRDDRLAYRSAGETSTLMADIATLRLEQRAALRAALKPANRVQFDTNIATLTATKN